MNEISLDGAYGEGGGALLRTALQMSCITQLPLTIHNVREGTKYPGLDIEDIQIIEILQEATAAKTGGIEAGAKEVYFCPTRHAKAVQIEADAVKSAGRKANALITLATVAPILAKAGAYSSLQACGETYGHGALTYSYFEKVTAKAWMKMGLGVFPTQEKAGFGRDSDGKVSLDIEPSHIDGLLFQARGQLKGCKGILTVCELPRTVINRATSHLSELSKSAGIKLDIEVETPPSSRTGAFLTLWAEYEHGILGTTVMNTPGIRIESHAQTGFSQLTDLMATQFTVDQYLADHLLIPGVLATGNVHFSVPKLTRRFLTMVWVIKQFLPIHLMVHGKEDGPGEVTIKKDY